MKPYYQDNFVTVYHGDMREVLPTLGRFDLVLTDPPYGIGRVMKGGKNTGHWNSLACGNAWDEVAPDISALLGEHLGIKIIWVATSFRCRLQGVF